MIDEWHPYDLEIEKIVLGSFIAEPDTLNQQLSNCFEDMFYWDVNKVVFDCIVYLHSKNINVDIISVRKRLQEINRLEFIGGDMAAVKLTDVFSSKIDYYITVLKQLYIKRRQIIVGQKFISEASNPTIDVFDTLAGVEGFLTEINQNISGNSYNFDMKVEAERVYNYMMAPKTERHTGIKTGNGSLTSLIGGWNPGELYYMCARPGHGKTSRMLQFALEAAFNNVPVDIYSLEMTKDELLKKMYLNVSDLHSAMVNSHSWGPEQLNLYTQAKERIKYAPIHINDSGYLKPKDLRTISHQRKRHNKLGMIMIDYLQIMSPDTDYRGNREREIGSISTSLKKLAKELQIPILALVQLSRDCEKRNNKRPQLADMRDSGQIEQDADVVLSLYSPSQYDNYEQAEAKYQSLSEEQYDQVSEMAILKNRNGMPGVILPEQFIRNKSLFKN